MLDKANLLMRRWVGPVAKINNFILLMLIQIHIYHYPRSQQNMKNREFGVTSRKIMMFSSHTIKTAVIQLSILFTPYRNLLNSDQQTNRKRIIGLPYVFTNYFFTKGQIISKRFFLAEDSSEKRTKTRRILVKTNSFLRFLEESLA